jgi:hypothetical protein
MSTSSHAQRRGRVTIPAPRGAAAISIAAFALAGCVGASMAATALDTSAPEPTKVEGEPLAPPAPDLANPTGHDVRGEDVYGAGAFGASRGGGARRHRGADYIAEPGEIVRAPIAGVVQRIGFAYRGDERYRYVELSDASAQRAVRVLYVGPLVQLGAVVRAGDPIGRAQDLSVRYPRGITNHVHVELKQGGVLGDPASLLPAADEANANLSHARSTI